MPLTKKGRKIMSNMREQYGDRAEEVFYASKNKGTISGVDNPKPHKKTKRVTNPSPHKRTARVGNTSPKKRTARKRRKS